MKLLIFCQICLPQVVFLKIGEAVEAQAIEVVNRVGHAVLEVHDLMGQVVIVLRETTPLGVEGAHLGHYKKLGGQPREPHGRLRLAGGQRLLHGELRNERLQGLNLGLQWFHLVDYLLFASEQPRQLQPP